MKILTLNTWQERGPWRERWKIILAGLAEHRPDFIGFQEVFNGVWAEEVRKVSGYPYLAFPKEPGGLMFLSRHLVKNWECRTLKTQSPTEDYMRYALWVEVEAAGRKLCFVNTHLSWRTLEGEIRGRQVEELAAFIAEKAPQGPMVVMGDFNAPPETAEVRKMAAAGFQDLFALRNPGVEGLTWDNTNPYAAGSSTKMPDRRIDFIFAKNVNLSSVQSVQRIYTQPSGNVYASDHYGVLAEFENGF